MSIDFREIVRDAAKRRLVELAKSYLDILDELKKEDAAKVSKILSVADEVGIGGQMKTLRPFLFLMDDVKKEMLRKRILDTTNALVRELDL